MITTEEIINNHDAQEYTFEPLYNEETVKSILLEYTKLVIDDILSKPSMITVENGEAVYDYEKFGEYVKSLE